MTAPHPFVPSLVPDVGCDAPVTIPGCGCTFRCAAPPSAPCHSAATPPTVTVLPESASSDAPHPSDGPDSGGTVGDRAADLPASTFLNSLDDGITALMRSSEKTGYERGYHACLAAVIERVKAGKPVDGMFLNELLYASVTTNT